MRCSGVGSPEEGCEEATGAEAHAANSSNEGVPLLPVVDSKSRRHCRRTRGWPPQTSSNSRERSGHGTPALKSISTRGHWLAFAHCATNVSPNQCTAFSPASLWLAAQERAAGLIKALVTSPANGNAKTWNQLPGACPRSARSKKADPLASGPPLNNKFRTSIQSPSSSNNRFNRGLFHCTCDNSRVAPMLNCSAQPFGALTKEPRPWPRTNTWPRLETRSPSWSVVNHSGSSNPSNFTQSLSCPLGTSSTIGEATSSQRVLQQRSSGFANAIAPPPPDPPLSEKQRAARYAPKGQSPTRTASKAPATVAPQFPGSLAPFTTLSQISCAGAGLPELGITICTSSREARSICWLGPSLSGLPDASKFEGLPISLYVPSPPSTLEAIDAARAPMPTEASHLELKT
mmetsp:Transcript_27783/g.92371  ORF Transcript_27783/g.92371 Transcript_27783/m.92371 type:complete len:403 (+) Transcript_27783:1861-3069(+)